MKPSIGRIVHLKLSADCADQINRRREPGAGHSEGWPKGAQAHSGNPVREGEIVPMIVTLVFSECVNGQAILDGNDSLWVTSVKEGTEPGTWCWPERVE